MRKGITAVSVSIMVVIMLILAGTVSITSYNSIQSANKITFALELSEIQEQVTRYYKDSELGGYPISDNVYTVNLANVTTSSLTQFDKENINSNNEITLYELDLTSIGVTDTKYGTKKTDKDVFAVSTQTGRVYYLEGLKYNGKTYYTITNDLIDIDQRNENVSDEEKELIPPVITTDGIVTKTLSSGEKEIYVSNIKVTGDDIQYVKYELGEIPEENAVEYFRSNGNTFNSDRIRLKELTTITIYAQNSQGEYDIVYVQNN